MTTTMMMTWYDHCEDDERWYDDGHNQKSEGLTEHLIFDGSIWEHYYTTKTPCRSDY